jgi:hypothetical protein
VTRSVNKLARFIQSPLVILATFLISIGSFSLALQANAQAAQEAKNRSEFLQEVLCDVFQPVAAQPLPPNVSAFGRSLSDGTKRSVTRLDCSPEINDGR